MLHLKHFIAILEVQERFPVQNGFQTNSYQCTITSTSSFAVTQLFDNLISLFRYIADRFRGEAREAKIYCATGLLLVL